MFLIKASLQSLSLQIELMSWFYSRWYCADSHCSYFHQSLGTSCITFNSGSFMLWKSHRLFHLTSTRKPSSVSASPIHVDDSVLWLDYIKSDMLAYVFSAVLQWNFKCSSKICCSTLLPRSFRYRTESFSTTIILCGWHQHTTSVSATLHFLRVAKKLHFIEFVSSLCEKRFEASCSLLIRARSMVNSNLACFDRNISSLTVCLRWAFSAKTFFASVVQVSVLVNVRNYMSKIAGRRLRSWFSEKVEFFRTIYTINILSGR